MDQGNETSSSVCDIRLKDAWVADTFAIGLCTARTARRHLLELSWLSEIDTPQ